MLIISLIFVLTFNLLGFLAAYSLQTGKIKDIFYVITFLGVTLIGLVYSPTTIVEWIISVAIFIWAIRLGTYSLKKIKLIGKVSRHDDISDDFWKLSGVWLLQAVSVWVVVLPSSLLFNADTKTISNPTLWIGFTISLVGIAIEAISDKQKLNFISDSKNKNLWIASGFWKYSRHPNYFGEILMWIGVYLMAAQWLAKPELYFAMLGPLTIAFLLLFVTGVPILEKSGDKKFGKNKKYAEYMQNTSVLIPLPKSKK